MCSGAFSNTEPRDFVFFSFWLIIHIQAQKGNTAWVGMFTRRRELLHNTPWYLHWGGTYSFDNTAGGGNWGASEEMLAVFQNKRVRRKRERDRVMFSISIQKKTIKAHGEREPCLWSLLLIRYVNVRLWRRHLEKNTVGSRILSQGNIKPDR